VFITSIILVERPAGRFHQAENRASEPAGFERRNVRATLSAAQVRKLAVIGPMLKVLIIADDLTGAADCGAVFAERGFRATVLLAGPEPSAFNQDWRDTEVLAIDANTRCMGPDQAAACVSQIVQAHVRASTNASTTIIFKKVDSTLRGNVAAELAAALQARRADTRPSKPIACLFAPAFPACGRTTVNGRQFVSSLPLENSGVWQREQLTPRNNIAAMLGDAGLACSLVDLGCVRAAAPALAKSIHALASAVDVVICDAESDADLESIVRAAMELDMTIVWSGSAGLARQIAGAAFPARTELLPAKPETHGPSLFVVGSPATASCEQARTLTKAQNLSVFTVAPSDLLTTGQACESQKCARRICEHLNRGNDVLVQFDFHNMLGAEQGRLLSPSLARIIAPCVNYVGALVATGGETARAILDAWGVRRLQLLGEVEPGLPYSICRCGSREILILTKAGGFGTPETLLHCHEFLRQCTVANAGTDMNKPIIAITMGDAAGVGPEVIVKSLAKHDVYEHCRPLVIGDAERLRRADRICAGRLTVRTLTADEVERAEYLPGIINCIDLKLIPSDLPWGKLSARAGEAAYQFLVAAAQLALEGTVGAICTAPLNKEALHAAGHKFPGHTELLAHLTGTPEVSMMLVTPKLRVVHVTTHVGLIDAIGRIEPGLVERTIARGHAALEKSGIANPRIGVCGINPHAGENGLFGYGEEEHKIVPAIRACHDRGWNVEGPLPADTLFYRAQRGDFDLVVAMYHDQGHGPVKVLGLESGVNITIGLPVVRTSVDHGTAFDIAGTGKADERSMLEAINQAVQLAPK
jgi:4-phospho-D-threonate 3-dehydrogenase / 4-phospho-D-erythronate 3-dehydrogenase